MSGAPGFGLQRTHKHCLASGPKQTWQLSGNSWSKVSHNFAYRSADNDSRQKMPRKFAELSSCQRSLQVSDTSSTSAGTFKRVAVNWIKFLLSSFSSNVNGVVSLISRSICFSPFRDVMTIEQPASTLNSRSVCSSDISFFGPVGRPLKAPCVQNKRSRLLQSMEIELLPLLNLLLSEQR